MLPNPNRLLAALPSAEYERVAPSLELVPLLLGKLLYEPGLQMEYAYFPTTAIASLHYVVESGESVETAGVGNEGVIGVPLFLGGDTTTGSAVVHTAGLAYRFERGLLKEEFNRTGATCSLLLRYTQALATHLTDRRLQSASPGGAATVALAVGGITEAAGQLQLAGFIQYRRGHISVLQRSGLEMRACECYAVLKREVARLFADVAWRS